MSENVAFVAPAWVWIFAFAFLALLFGAFGWLLCWALGLRHTLNRLDEYEEHGATKVDVDRDVGELRREVELLKRRPKTDTLISPA